MSSGLRNVAIGLAVAALGLTSITAFVVLTRDGGTAEAKTDRAPTYLERKVDASAIAQIRRDNIEQVNEHGVSIGIRVTDPTLRGQLGLGNDDMIVAISGREVRTESDVVTTLTSISFIKIASMYIELRRAGLPLLVRWQLDGDLGNARRHAPDTPPTRLPSVAPVADPILATIEKVDDTHFEMPSDTADKITRDPSTYTKTIKGFASYSGKGGFRLAIIAPGSLADAIGLRRGDTLESINGENVTTLDQLDRQLATMTDADKWSLEVDRDYGSSHVTITITVK